MNKTPLERMMSRVVVTDDGCWDWTGATMSSGYGCIGFGGKGKSVLTHRLSYEMHREPIPADMTIDHLCFNKTCVNPDHLEVVTRSENSSRAHRDKTHCKRGHELAGDNVMTKSRGPGRSPQRQCRTCANWRQRLARAAAS